MNNFYGNPETIQTIQQYEMYELIYRKVRLGVEESIALFSKIRDYRLYEKMTYFFVNCLSCIFIYGILVYKICLGAISIGDFALCYGVIIGVSSAIAGIIEDYAKIKIAVTRLDDYIFLFDSMNKCENEIGNTDFEFTDSDVIRLKDVSYKYPESDKNVLNKINLELYNNEKVAIVGPNGAGKSTLVKCICGLLPVTEGDIFIGTKNIKNMNQVQKKEFFGTVFQEYAYLPFSLGENISLKENYNRDRAINLLNGFNCDGKLIANKNNIDKIVALSEGQKQKVAVSRARYEKHKCYILDEPSASMDILSEQKLYEEYGKITNEKLCILISHRMTSCIHSDRIIVMDQGSIIDIGSHIELLKRCKLYRTMWEKQTEHYIE